VQNSGKARGSNLKIKKSSGNVENTNLRSLPSIRPIELRMWLASGRMWGLLTNHYNYLKAPLRAKG